MAPFLGDAMNWSEHVEKWKNCRRCPLCTQRTNIVLARGTVPCDVLFVGEAPGASEDALGRPFVGPAGRLLDQVIERAVPPGVPYAMTNLVACFPAEAKARGENEPELAEIRACRQRLYEFIEIARPKLVALVGVLASDYIGHGADGLVCGAQTVDLDHPAYILRMPIAQKGMAFQRAVVRLRCAVEKMLGESNAKA